jgi:hypothetical protein
MSYVSPANISIAGNINPGDLIRIVSNDGVLDPTQSIYFKYTPASGPDVSFTIPDDYVFVYEPTVAIFMIPPFIELVFEDDPPSVPPTVSVIPVIIIDDPGIFTGPIYLDAIPVIMTNASGIYEISTDSLFDTLYDNVNAPDTVEVAIPDPFAKTGFIGG